MNKVAIENVRNHLFVKGTNFRDARNQAIEEKRIPSQIEMYDDMYRMYLELLELFNTKYQKEIENEEKRMDSVNWKQKEW